MTDPASWSPRRASSTSSSTGSRMAASRFRARLGDSAGIHRAGGGTVAVSHLLCELLATALRAAELTDGARRPDGGCRPRAPRLRPRLRRGGPGGGRHLPAPAPCPGWRSVALDADRGILTVPAGTVLDLGATAKAWAADRAAATISGHLGCGALVSLGGDVAVRSAPVGGFVDRRRRRLRRPRRPHRRRRALGWPGHLRHRQPPLVARRHTGPPRGRPAAPACRPPPCWRTVTVAAGSCVDANTASTASLVLGEGAPDWLAARHLPARLVRVDGTVVTVAGWPDDTLTPGGGRSDEPRRPDHGGGRAARPSGT